MMSCLLLAIGSRCLVKANAVTASKRIKAREYRIDFMMEKVEYRLAKSFAHRGLSYQYSLYPGCWVRCCFVARLARYPTKKVRLAPMVTYQVQAMWVHPQM